MEFEKPQRKAAMLGGDAGKFPFIWEISCFIIIIIIRVYKDSLESG